MKRFILVFMALLCFLFNCNSQVNRINFPLEGSVFQQSGPVLTNQTATIAISGQIKDNPGLRNWKYSIKKKTGDNTFTSISADFRDVSYTSNENGDGNEMFHEPNFTLFKGWYKITLFYRRFGKDYIAHTVEFGVGDVYYVAGQSNAAGYGGAGYNLIGAESSIRDNTNSSTLAENTSIMSRVFDSKQDEQSTIFYKMLTL
jgi:hypothetical protein